MESFLSISGRYWVSDELCLNRLFIDISVKRIVLLAVLLTCSLTVFSQGFDRSRKESLTKLFNPPNGAYLYDSVFIDETEITNLNWLEYLHYIQIDSSVSFYQSQLPDSSCWEVHLQPADSTNPFLAHYLRYPGFRHFPVIGVTYEQAVNYCKWRSDAVNDYIRTGHFTKKYPLLEKYDVSVEFRLPTKEEWEFAASGGLDTKIYPYGMIRPSTRKGSVVSAKYADLKCLDRNNIHYTKSTVIHKVEFNVYEDYYLTIDEPVISCHMDNPTDIAYIYENPPNPYGLYNIIGNVAEMTATKGVAKGGSFKHRLSETTVDANFYFESPKEWLGFRCAAVVHVKARP